MDGKKIIALLCGAAGMLCATGLGLTASLSARETASIEGGGSANDLMAVRALASHNAERTRLGLPRLKWNRRLEHQAGQWARVLAARGALQHADQRMRNAAGENLWMGTTGGWPVESMVGMFIDEKKHYRHDKFPNISRTGNWADVGHYTQIVWRQTQEVGCALHTARGNDVLVCRYWPAGNIYGQTAY